MPFNIHMFTFEKEFTAGLNFSVGGVEHGIKNFLGTKKSGMGLKSFALALIQRALVELNFKARKNLESNVKISRVRIL